ncbi:lipopolysaccharide biosynthesis protein, partial [Streptococcus pyogenes]
MAIAILSGKYDEFKTIQLNLFKYLALASVIILIGSGLVGIPFLSILYAIKLNNYWVTFMLIMMGGAIGSFATAIDNIL